MAAVITIQFVVPVGYDATDYARLHGTGGSGSIDWDTPLDNREYDLFPGGAGIYGWGLAPWGHSRWGHGHSMLTAGFGHQPFGHHPFGHGTGIVEAKVKVDYCGDYKFGFACYNQAGNIHEGSPQEIDVPIHIAPPRPTGLVKNSYVKETGVLVLDAA
jgi:hypothetical protein